MNSYPAELTHHAYASMLVAGLTKPSPRSAPLARSESSSSRTGRSGASPSQPQGNSEATSSPSREPSAPVAGPSSSPLVALPTDFFPELCEQLAEVFLSRGRNAVWDPARGRSAVFHSVMVDHTVRLPPRKTRPSPRSIAAPDSTTNSAAQLAALQPRSPLSPLHPGSPLFPDGLVAPIWARKHRDLVPSVFVAFHCLVEPYVEEDAAAASAEPNASAEVGQQRKRKGLTGQELKARDDELIKLISDRKRGLVERGIKLTVVLLTSRAMLENAQLEARLSYIRRSSGLDSKASLFVLTPVPQSELGDFVTSLQTTLYEHSLDYYREHARRVRRKRARYPPSPAVVQPILQSVAASRPGGKAVDLTPLSREGWHARAEYKLAMFSEFHGDYESALSHYQEAYDLLAGQRGMLGSTMLLPPRTKRWAEAKVLCDTVSLRICRLYLYGDNGEAALTHFRKHVARFVELSSGWGIGDATFEFWSWLSKQYRLMGDLLDQATRLISGSPLPPFLLPLHAPPLPSYLLHPKIADHTQDFPSLRAAPNGLLSPNQAAMAAGTTTAGVLQGPGAFYYLAAVCAEERQKRFYRMRELEKKGEVSEGGAAALVHEKTVDHAAQIVEVYDRAREAFRAVSQQRHSCYAAAKIASVHAQAGQWKLALRFLQRLIRTYKADDWPLPLSHLLTSALICAEQCEDLHSETQLLLTAMAAMSSLPLTERGTVVSRWSSLVSHGADFVPNGAEDATREPTPITFEATRGPLVARVVFKEQAVAFGTSAAFQVTIENPRGSDGPTLSFEEIVFNDQGGAVVCRREHRDEVSAAKGRHLTLDDVGLLDPDQCETSTADLVWPSGCSKTYSGRILSRSRDTLRISSIELKARHPIPYVLQLNVAAGDPLQSPEAPLWLAESKRGKCLQWVHLEHRPDASSCFIKAPSHKLSVDFKHHPVGFLDEAIIVEIIVANEDRDPLVCSADVMLQPAYAGSQDELGQSIGGQPTLSGSLKDLSFGSIAPGAAAQTSFFLRSRHRSGVRSMTIFVQSRSGSAAMNGDSEAATGASEGSELVSETVNDISIPIQRIFRAEYSAEWRKGTASADGPGGEDMSRGGSQLSDGSSGAAASIADDSFDEIAKSSLVKQVQTMATANLHAAFGVLSKEAITISDVVVSLQDEQQHSARLVAPKSDTEEAARRRDEVRKFTLDGQWREGDRWGFSWLVEVDLKGSTESNRGPTGHLVITWARARPEGFEQGGEGGAAHDFLENISRLPLPILAPPHLNARVLVASPPVTHTLQPFTLVFVVVNPSSSQMDVNVFIDDSPVWIVGNRTLSIPGIPARGSRSVPTRLVPRQEGTWMLPRVRAFQQRTKEEMEAGLILNESQYGVPLHVRFRASAGATLGAAAMRAIASGAAQAEQEGPALSVLVLPQDTSA